MTYAPATLASRSWRLTTRGDPVLIMTSLILATTGAVMVYSATRSQLVLNGDDPHYYLKRQAVFIVVGVLLMAALATIDYRRLEQASTILYIGTLFALLGVYVVGTSSQGAQRWFSLGPLQLQPSEFATLVLILAIATYCNRRPDGLDFRDLVRMVLLAAVPILLVIKQPDLGTAVVMAVTLMVMLAVAGMPGRYLLLLIVGALLVAVVAWKSGLLQQYQIQRLTGFISPNGKSGQEVHYNVSQAKNAIADGGIFGKGLFHGTSTNLAYVPERQTDFIFSAVGEQLGFVGTGVILLLYGVLAWRILRTAQLARDMLGRLLCTGVFALLVFSVFENAGMNMGIMPVTGIPLPFLSYGGSAMIAFFIAIGLVSSVHARSVSMRR
ncbi:MAG: rod shape-determining protein RodA [Acidimicrobiales bacterium]|nr:rod shape-determining protein RodA [Acidimicrobiales bacterium]